MSTFGTIIYSDSTCAPSSSAFVNVMTSASSDTQGQPSCSQMAQMAHCMAIGSPPSSTQGNMTSEPLATGALGYVSYVCPSETQSVSAFISGLTVDNFASTSYAQMLMFSDSACAEGTENGILAIPLNRCIVDFFDSSPHYVVVSYDGNFMQKNYLDAACENDIGGGSTTAHIPFPPMMDQPCIALPQGSPDGKTVGVKFSIAPISSTSIVETTTSSCGEK